MIYITAEDEVGRMDKNEQFEYALRKTEVIRPARQSLYTFSSTRINYTIVTELTDKILVEVRKGKATVEKPAIMAPSYFADNLLEGFDSEQVEYIEMMMKKFGLRALRYKYGNETKDVKLISGRLQNVIDRVRGEVNAAGDSLAAIIKGVPGMWGVSLMKYMIEMIGTSFPGNVKELEERGWFTHWR